MVYFLPFYSVCRTLNARTGNISSFVRKGITYKKERPVGPLRVVIAVEMLLLFYYGVEKMSLI